MPKNKCGGNKHKKKKNHEQTNTDFPIIDETNRDYLLYGLAIKNNGGNFFEVKCSDDKIRLGHIRGKMRKRNWINVNDYLLLSTRDFQNTQYETKEKCDIIYKYTPQQAKLLNSVHNIVIEDSNDVKYGNSRNIVHDSVYFDYDDNQSDDDQTDDDQSDEKQNENNRTDDNQSEDNQSDIDNYNNKFIDDNFDIDDI